MPTAFAVPRPSAVDRSRRRRHRGDPRRRLECARRRLAARLARVPSRAARDRLRVARIGLDAVLPHRLARRRRSPARCRSTRRRTRTASTCSTGRGRTPIAATAAATIRSSSRRFRSRRRRARGSSPPTTPCAPHCCAPRSRRLQPPRHRGDPPFSSLHVLFPTEAEARACEAAGMLRAQRRAVPLGESGLSRFRRLPRDVQPRQAQEGEAGAAARRREPASPSRARSAPRSPPPTGRSSTAATSTPTASIIRRRT